MCSDSGDDKTTSQALGRGTQCHLQFGGEEETVSPTCWEGRDSVTCSLSKICYSLEMNICVVKAWWIWLRPPKVKRASEVFTHGMKTSVKQYGGDKK
jgi:hypothetical protein